MAINTKIIKFAWSVLQKDSLIKLGIPLKKCFNAPYTVTVAVTDRCNAHCITCDRWKTPADHKELTIEEWKKFLRYLSDWVHPCYVSFTGGEPFIRDDFLELLRYTRQLDIYSHISTNGIALTRKMCNRLLDIGVDFILFSLNSIDASLHDRYKGAENTHSGITSAIQYLKSKNPGICIGVTLIITKDNYRTLGDFTTWCSALGIDSINFQPIRDNFGPNFSPIPSVIATPDNLYYKIDDLEAFDREIDTLIVQKKKGAPIAVPFSDLYAFKGYFRDPYRISRRSYCDVGYRNLLISSHGEVKLCYMFPTIGNILNDHIKDIWFSQEAHIQRIKMAACQKPCVSACLRKFSLTEKFFNFSIRARTIPR